MTSNGTRQAQHLKKCPKYHSAMRAAEKRKQGTPGTLPFDHLSEAEHSKLDKAAATMVYDTGLPLSFFEHTSVKAFFQ
jgi:hypothetical protein